VEVVAAVEAVVVDAAAVAAGAADTAATGSFSRCV